MKNILVFPCGSEIALEIHKSLKYSTHFNLIGASSVNDHGKFIFEDYISDIPFHNHKDFISKIKQIVQEHNIDAIYPAMDLVALTLKMHEKELGCKVVGSSPKATQICSSKTLTYELLKNRIGIPKIYENIEHAKFPIFIKPDIGYGSRNTFLAQTKQDAKTFLEQKKDIGKFLLCEYLPKSEYTIDCFSNKDRELTFFKARQRARVSNGISVNTSHTQRHLSTFEKIANIINEELKPQGAWFFQMKEDENKTPKLLEVAVRLGGSSSLCRTKGVNFAMLTLFDAFNNSVTILENHYNVELDRALSNKYKTNIEYSTLYIDYDDCIIINEKVNLEALQLIYKAINDNKKVVLITRHLGNLVASLKKHRLSNLFDDIFHIQKNEKKSNFIKDKNSIFIDDSHVQRVDVALTHNISVFSPDMIEVLL